MLEAIRPDLGAFAAAGEVAVLTPPLDVFFAGDGAEAKAQVAAFLESVGVRPRDAGGLELTYVLEWAGILLVGLASDGAGFDIAFSV